MTVPTERPGIDVGAGRVLGTGGGLWFSRENPETGIEDGHLHLIDYDGMACLPGAVITMLRSLGVSVDRNFE